MVLASDDSDVAGSSGRIDSGDKGGSGGNDGSTTKGDSGSKGNSRSGSESDSRGTDGVLISDTDSVGNHSGLEGPRELDPEEVGESTMSSSKAESGGEESA